MYPISLLWYPVDVHVKRLREKLETVNANWSLKTVWGVGYKFEVL